MLSAIIPKIPLKPQQFFPPLIQTTIRFHGNHGHNDDEDSYEKYQKRLDRSLTGAPASETLMKILRIITTPKEARLASRLPTVPTPLSKLSKELKMPIKELDEQISVLADKGLVFDMVVNKERYFSLVPIVLGFFEFIMMRAKNPYDLPIVELSKLFDTYMYENNKFANSVFHAGDTQIGRALVQEETLPHDSDAKIYDYEKATEIIKTATRISLSLCSCRRKSKNAGHPCKKDAPLETCLTFNGAAEYLIRHDIAEEISKEKALEILADSKKRGLVQIDDVQKDVSYMCNCCGCCCGMLQAKDTTFHMQYDICLGCGVCVSKCKFGALSMIPRKERVYTPETAFEKYIAMALERGKIANLLFEYPEKFSHRALGRIISMMEKLPPLTIIKNNKKLKSRFVSKMAELATKKDSRNEPKKK
ncbi:4fe-4s ferredoxin [Anaeramoeba ignava]|uniref:4fe-4s ferredoxin n=1 Tax=Anaeramoeba ignava TaxID=1746090 RepID=A0A9Q0RBW9_ANAIG|nr:4fe-4s ferredoxin [Anaeramoeba ignava]